MFSHGSYYKSLIQGIFVLLIMYLLRGAVIHSGGKQRGFFHGSMMQGEMHKCTFEQQDKMGTWKTKPCQSGLQSSAGYKKGKYEQIKDSFSKNISLPKKKTSNDGIDGGKGGKSPSMNSSNPKQTTSNDERFDFLKAGGYIDSELSIESFDPENNITRKEIVPFLLQYANTNNLKQNSAEKCVFEDIIKLPLLARKDVVQVCQYGLLKGTKGNFNPDTTLNQAEMLAILVRSTQGYLDEKQPNRFDSYYAYAVSRGYVKGGLDKELLLQPLTKKDVGVWLYHMAKIQGADQILYK